MCFRRLKVVSRQKRGNLTSRLAVRRPGDEDEMILTDQRGVEEAALVTLAERFTDARSSPFSPGRLLDDVGHMGEGPAVQQILDGTYEFPEGCDPAVRQLCTEASRLFAKTAEEVVETFAKRKDFQELWLTANENISSSKSGAHFGHYKSAAHSNYLLALRTAKLNLAL